jgi:hypothetical protein
VSAGSACTSPSKPSKAIAILTLRPNGDADAERRIIMDVLCDFADAGFFGQELVTRRTAPRGV